jgi:hypothetical protein
MMKVTQVNQLSGQRFLLVFGTLGLGGAQRQGMHLAHYLKSLGCDVRVWGHLGLEHYSENGGSALAVDAERLGQ